MVKIRENFKAKPIIIFFGPAGSGKGTQADLLVKKTNWHKITVGELLRKEISLNTSLGKQANKYLLKGILVPDILINKLLLQHLKKFKSTRGLIFDGYPRSKSQLKNLLVILEKLVNKNISLADNFFAIVLNVSDKEVKQRLGGRRSCSCGAVYHLKYSPPKKDQKCDLCGGKLIVRSDDKPKAIVARLKVFHRQVEPILDYFRKNDKLITVNGEQSIAKIHHEIVIKLRKLKLMK